MSQHADSLPPPSHARARLVVLTDMTSVTAGELEPDDGQSLIRLLLFANHFDIAALIAGSNLEHGDRCRPDIIHRIVDAYAACHTNLLQHDANYPHPDHLHARTHGGWPIAGRKIPVDQSIGATRDTDASRALIALVDEPDPRPIWIVVWGGTADLAQALWRVQHTRTPAEQAAFVAKLRVHAIADQDTTAAWLKETFPALFYITRRMAFRGMYRGGDTSLCSSAWIQTHLRGHGALGDLYPDYNGGDIWSGKLGQVAGLKEGDTPSYLSLIPNGLNDALNPAWGGWGGVLQPEAAPREGFPPHRWTDAVDPLPWYAADPDPHMAGVYRWRPAFQADFAARMDACVQPPEAVNRPPRIQLNTAPHLTLSAGESLHLSAAGSHDPRGTKLVFQWFCYPQPSPALPQLLMTGADSPELKITAPPVAAPTTLQIILAATNAGTPPLTAYRRVCLHMVPR